MIHITQGHERSISLEILFNAFKDLTSKEASRFMLHANKESVICNINDIKSNIFIKKNVIKINNNFLNTNWIHTDSNLPQSTTSMLAAISDLKTNDILLTMPTSKDQLLLNNEKMLGHTEFLRKFYNTPNLSMMFLANDERMLLLTDHLPLKDVSKAITADFVENKMTLALSSYVKSISKLKEVVFSGINPHAGEDGLLGDEDLEIAKGIEKLKKIFPDLIFKGPLPGDTLHIHRQNSSDQLLVYAYHDQGLSVFKERNKFLGLNITLGLPFIRLSVDHGTAFELYGKNSANYDGALYALKSAIAIEDSYGTK